MPRTNQTKPTKEVIKSRVKRRSATSFPTWLNNSCRKHALQEVINVALKYNRHGGRPRLVKLGTTATGGRLTLRQLLLYEKNFGWIVFWQLDPEVLGPLWLKACVTWAGNQLG